MKTCQVEKKKTSCQSLNALNGSATKLVIEGANIGGPTFLLI